MKIFDPVCFGECALKDYLGEIMILLFGIAILVGIISLICFGLYKLISYFTGKVSK